MALSIPLEQLGRYRRHFPGPHLGLVLDSIAAGNTVAALWQIAGADAAPLLLLWDGGNNVFYLAGEDPTTSALEQLAELIARSIRPQALAAGAAYFKTRAVSPALEAHLPRIFAGVPLGEYRTCFFASPAARPAQPAQPQLPNLRVVPITPDLLSSDALSNREQVRAEIQWMWPSEARFFAQGFGSLALSAGEIICWCTAEYVGPARCGIGITTIPAYEGRGVATATAMSFLQAAELRGLTACWECGQANAGSMRVAAKLGLTPVAEEIYWVGQFTA